MSVFSQRVSSHGVVMLSILALSASSVSAQVSESYLGLYLGGNKIGYSSYASRSEKLAGKATTRTDSRTLMSTGLLGTAMTLQMDSVTWTDAAGKPVKMTTLMKSGGRAQTFEAIFGATAINITLDNAGQRTTRKLVLPTDGPVVDDPLAGMVVSKTKTGTTRSFYVLDPTTISLVKNEARFKGPTTTMVRGKKVQANLVEVIDPRAPTRVFLAASGAMIKVEGPMGIEMFPETKKVALAGMNSYNPGMDLAVLTSLKLKEPITSPDTISKLTLKVVGRDLSTAPSDAFQTLKGSGNEWTIQVHPPVASADPAKTIAEAGAEQPEWLKAGLHIPAASPTMVRLAKEKIGDAEDVREAAERIRKYVNELMTPNAGIGVLRDAAEVLKTKEGVCRDYAILTTTLLRAGGIPARVVAGLVNQDGAFYYHAWAEYWNGTNWIGCDSTQPWDQITAVHVKLSEGTVENAFTFLFLDRVKVEVVSIERKP